MNSVQLLLLFPDSRFYSAIALDLSVILVANKTDLVRNRVVRTPGKKIAVRILNMYKDGSTVTMQVLK